MTNTNQTFLRIEHKYLISEEQMKKFLNLIQDKIKPDIYPEYDLNNIYLDTENYDIIRSCQDDISYKEKLRIRSYGNPGENTKVFVEIKKKYKGLGEKRRTEIEYKNLDNYLESPSENTQIEKELKYALTRNKIEPKMFISYHRIAYDGIEEDDLRITFDTNIKYRENSLNMCGNNVDKLFHFNSDKNIILEIKLAERYPLWLTKALSEINAYRTSFSKYGTLYKKKIKENYTPFWQTNQIPVKEINKTENQKGVKNQYVYQSI